MPVRQTSIQDLPAVLRLDLELCGPGVVVRVCIVDNEWPVLDLVSRHVVRGVLLDSVVEHLDGVAVGPGIPQRRP